MIVFPDPTFADKTLSWHQSVVPAILGEVLAAMAVGLVAAVVDWYLRTKAGYTQGYILPSFEPFTTLGVAVSLFLGFRTNSCYARWWEGRQQWGKQVIVTRHIPRVLELLLPDKTGAPVLKPTTSLVPSPPPHFTPSAEAPGNSAALESSKTLHGSPASAATSRETQGSDVTQAAAPAAAPPGEPEGGDPVSVAKRAIGRLGVAHTHALRAQLRTTWLAGMRNPSPDPTVQDAIAARDTFVPPEHVHQVAAASNPADAIVHLAGRYVGALLSQGHLDTYGAVAVSKAIDGLGETQAAMERLATAPVPFPYMLLVHRTVFLYVYISPFALVSSLRWWAPIFSGIISYTFFGLEEVARQCEQPFGNEANSLPLDAMCRVVEISVAQALGDKPPALLKPDNRKRLR